MDFRNLPRKEQKKLVVDCLKERVEKAQDKAIKNWHLEHFDTVVYFGVDLRVAFSGHCIEEAILKMEKYLMKNARTHNNKRVSLICDTIKIACEFSDKEEGEGDCDIEAWTDEIIEILEESDTLWIEEYLPYPII